MIFNVSSFVTGRKKKVRWGRRFNYQGNKERKKEEKRGRVNSPLTQSFALCSMHRWPLSLSLSLSRFEWVETDLRKRKRKKKKKKKRNRLENRDGLETRAMRCCCEVTSVVLSFVLSLLALLCFALLLGQISLARSLARYIIFQGDIASFGRV